MLKNIFIFAGMAKVTSSSLIAKQNYYTCKCIYAHIIHMYTCIVFCVCYRQIFDALITEHSYIKLE